MMKFVATNRYIHVMPHVSSNIKNPSGQTRPACRNAPEDFAFMSYCKQLRFDNNLYIARAGYVFRIKNSREKRLKIRISKNGNPMIHCGGGNHFNLFSLMVEYWLGPVKTTDTIRYKMNKDGSVPLDNIRVIPLTSDFTDLLSEEDEVLLKKYNCSARAGSANSRSDQVITPVEVFLSLKTHKFKCVYCNRGLTYDNWSLDHYYPLSAANGQNVFNNIVPSCPVCNRMKGTLDPLKFIRKCISIANNNQIKNEDLQKLLTSPP